MELIKVIDSLTPVELRVVRTHLVNSGHVDCKNLNNVLESVIDLIDRKEVNSYATVELDDDEDWSKLVLL